MSEIQVIPYEDFERKWKQQHKASLPRKVHVSSVQEYFWIVFWILIAIGAAVFSAAHTIPAALLTIPADVPRRETLAVTAFIIAELVIFGASAKRREINWLKYLLVAAMAVALIGNVSSSVMAVFQNGGTGLNQAAGILLSIIAPLCALASGEVLHIQLDKLNEKRRIAQEIFDSKWKEIEARINQAYSKHVKEVEKANASEREKERELERQKAEIEAGKSVNLQNLPSLQPSRPSEKLQKALDWLAEHPDQLEGESRELANFIGVSHMTVFKAQQMMKNSNGHSQNGHGGDE